MNKSSLLALAVVTALAVAACGGGSSDTALPPTQTNTAPGITGLSSQTINQDTSTGAIAFTIGDTQSGAGPLQVSASSSNLALIPADAVVLGGSGAARTITLTPVEEVTGMSEIAVSVRDPEGLTSTVRFTVNVQAVQASMLGFTTTLYARGESEIPTEVRGLTFVQDADDSAAFENLLQ